MHSGNVQGPTRMPASRGKGDEGKKGGGAKGAGGGLGGLGGGLGGHATLDDEHGAHH